MAGQGSAQNGQFRTLAQLLETLLLTRLQMFQRGISPQMRRVLTGTESAESLWAEAVANELLAVRLLVPGGPEGGVPLGRLADQAAEALTELGVMRAQLVEADPALAQVPPPHNTPASLLAAYLEKLEARP